MKSLLLLILLFSSPLTPYTSAVNLLANGYQWQSYTKQEKTELVDSIYKELYSKSKEFAIEFDKGDYTVESGIAMLDFFYIYAVDDAQENKLQSKVFLMVPCKKVLYDSFFTSKEAQ